MHISSFGAKFYLLLFSIFSVGCHFEHNQKITNSDYVVTPIRITQSIDVSGVLTDDGILTVKIRNDGNSPVWVSVSHGFVTFNRNGSKITAMSEDAYRMNTQGAAILVGEKIDSGEMLIKSININNYVLVNDDGDITQLKISILPEKLNYTILAGSQQRLVGKVRQFSGIIARK